MKIRETLLRETGVISPNRVSEETRKKVMEESEMIRNKMIENYHSSRARFRKEENERLRRNEAFRNKINQKWKEDMANSPYLIDQCRVDDERRHRLALKEIREKIYKEKVQIVSNMRGKADDPVLTKSNSRHLEPKIKLALSLRQSYRDEKVIKEEQQILDVMLQNELTTIANKFPTLPVLDHISKNGESNEQSLTSMDTSQSPSFEVGRSLTTTSSSIPFSSSHPRSSSREKSKKSKKLHTSSSSTLSGPMEYTSPQKRMAELQEQASYEFSIRRFETIDPSVASHK